MKGKKYGIKILCKNLQNENMDAAYVEVPYDIKELFGKGRLLVNATLTVFHIVGKW